MHSPLMTAWGFCGPRMSDACGMRREGGLAEQAEKGGAAMVEPPIEEEDKEEDQRRDSSLASG